MISKLYTIISNKLFWELSIVSSLSLYGILAQHACNDHAWLTSECSPKFDN